jgi:hypothetical protein
VHVLRKLHAALIEGGLLVDTQPVSRHPPVETATAPLGTLDMTDWGRTLDEIDRRIGQAIDAELFDLLEDRRLTVTDVFGSGSELLEEARQWAGTTIDRALEQRIADERLPVRVHQEVRLRVLRARAR